MEVILDFVLFLSFSLSSEVLLVTEVSKNVAEFSVLLPANSYVFLSHWDLTNSYKEIILNPFPSQWRIFLRGPW